VNPTQRVDIRAATEKDRETVLAFSNLWGSGDYLPFVWDRWLVEQPGRLLVATIKGQPVAVAHVVMVSPGEAWYEGLRVDANFRRQGIAARLTVRCIEEARAAGAGIIRFTTASTNEPVHRMAASLGFERIVSLSPFRAGAARGGPALTLAKMKDVRRLLAFLKDSAVMKAMGDLSNSNWRFQGLTEDVLLDRLKGRRVRMLEKEEEIAAVAMSAPSYRSKGFVVSYADGEPSALRDLLFGLRTEASANDPPELTAWLPDGLVGLKLQFTEAGFAAYGDGGLLVYEKRI